MLSLLSQVYKVVNDSFAGVNKWIDEKFGQNVRKTIVWVLIFLAGMLSGYGVLPSLDKANVEQPKIEKGE